MPVFNLVTLYSAPIIFRCYFLFFLLGAASLMSETVRQQSPHYMCRTAPALVCMDVENSRTFAKMFYE